MQYFGFDRPSFAFKTYGFGANPDAAILALFAGGKQGVWYDPSDKSTLFQDVAGTIPVTKDGDPIGLMKDKSGNGYHATQTASASRPTYRTDGILHWLEFDGVDDFLQTSYVPTSNWSSGVGLTVAKDNGSFLFESNLTAANNYYTSNLLRVFSPPSDISSTGIPISLNTANKFVVRVSGDNVGTSPISVGARYIGMGSSSFNFGGRLFGLVIVSAYVSIEDLNTLDEYMAKRAGVIL